MWSAPSLAGEPPLQIVNTASGVVNSTSTPRAVAAWVDGYDSTNVSTFDFAHSS